MLILGGKFQKREFLLPVGFVADHGDLAAVDGGVDATATITATGPDVIIFFTCASNDADIVSATVGGVEATILAQFEDDGLTVGIIHFAGAPSGAALVVTLDTDLWINGMFTIASFANIDSLTPIDVVTDAPGSSNIAFTGLVSPGASGLTLVAGVCTTAGTVFTPSNVTELANANSGERHFAGYVLGVPAGVIGLAAAAANKIGVAAALR